MAHRRQTFVGVLITILFTVVAFSSLAYSSSPQPGWSHRWTANVWNTYCELKLDYNIPFRSDPDKRGIFAGRSIDRLFARFAASTRTHYGLIPEEKLFKIRFSLHFYGENGHDPAVDDLIASANIGGITMTPPEKVHAGILAFSLDEEDTSLLMQRFTDNERVEVLITFGDGKESRSTIYPSGDRDFHVWAAMFRTCIRENIGPRR